MSKRRKEKLGIASRRQFLAMAGGGGVLSLYRPAGLALLSGLVDGLIAKANAQTTGVSPRNFIFVGMSGGPPRWMFDKPLTPFGGTVAANPSVGCRFKDIGGRYSELVYESTPITQNGVTIQMPYFWTNTIPTSSGGTVPMGNLMANMMMIRGVTMGADGHNNNYLKTTRPILSNPSLDGRVADAAPTPVPAVALNGAPHQGYRSEKGIGVTIETQIYGQYADPLTRILGPFLRSQDGLTTGYLSKRNALEGAVTTAMEALAAHAKSTQPGAENLFTIAGQAETLIKASFGNLSDQYRSLYNKYNNLIKACAATKINGITDKSVLYSDIPKISGTNRVIQAAQGTKKFYVTNSDFSTLIGTNTSCYMAETFAVAEFLILNKYSTSVTLGVGRVENLNITSAKHWATNTDANVADVPKYGDFDEHHHGSYLSLIGMGFTYKCLAACLYELITRLKAANLFDETVIELGSEMCREPRVNNTTEPDDGEPGSYHGWEANNFSVFSGVIKKPIVIGNCLINAKKKGSWGAAAPVNVEGQPQELVMGHVTSTVAKLLRVAPVAPNNGSLVVEDSSGVTQVIENAKNV